MDRQTQREHSALPEHHQSMSGGPSRAGYAYRASATSIVLSCLSSQLTGLPLRLCAPGAEKPSGNAEMSLEVSNVAASHSEHNSAILCAFVAPHATSRLVMKR